MWLSVVLSQLPFIVVAVAAAVVAAIVVRGPARWIAVGGILAGVLTTLVTIVMIGTGYGPSASALSVVSTVIALAGIALSVLSVVVAQRWGRQQAHGGTIPGQQPPVMPR